MKKITQAALIMGTGAVAIGLTACGPMPRTHTYGTTTPGVTHAPTYSAPPAPIEPVSNNTPGQDQAIDKAQSYLDYTAFSRSGLVKQLEFEGFAAADAEFAVSQIDVDWNEQAAKKAQSYLDYTSFSQSGLINQLEFEGFTSTEAQYGASAVYGG